MLKGSGFLLQQEKEMHSGEARQSRGAGWRLRKNCMTAQTISTGASKGGGERERICKTASVHRISVVTSSRGRKESA